jgi:glycosyltransferase involved in cell wall biosynthesis
MRVALIHDWLNGMRGGEKVLEALCEIFPEATIFTLFYQRGKVSSGISSHKVKTSFLNKIPGMKKSYRNLLPLYPKAMEALKLDKFDLCISVSHSVAKGIRPGPNSLHICVCLTPMRYIWDRFDDYFTEGESGQIKRQLVGMLRSSLRRWDVNSSSRVALFISISKFVKRRIKKFYNRPSTVIYPFVDSDFYRPMHDSDPSSNRVTSDYFLAVSALVPYKRIQDIVEAFRSLEERVIIVGDGPEKNRLKKIAPPNVEFTGWLSNERILELYRNCQALIFPGVEDFGIVPIEAQACGKPVIALAEGGALETVNGPIIGVSESIPHDASGLFYKRPGSQYIVQAIERFKTMRFDGWAIRNNALKFSRQAFIKNINEYVTESYSRFKSFGVEGLEEQMNASDLWIERKQIQV